MPRGRPLRSLAQRDATEVSRSPARAFPAAVPRTPGWERRKSAMISGNKCLPVSDGAATTTEPEPLLRNWVAPRHACTRRATARSMWLATRSPARVSRTGSASSSPNASSKTRRCVWRSPAGRGGRRERFLPSKRCNARYRASSFITSGYTGALMYFFLRRCGRYGASQAVTHAPRICPECRVTQCH